MFSWVTTLWSAIVSFFSDIFSAFWNALLSGFNFIFSALSTCLDFVYKCLTWWPQYLIAWAQHLIMSKIDDILTSYGIGIADKLQSAQSVYAGLNFFLPMDEFLAIVTVLLTAWAFFWVLKVAWRFVPFCH